MRGRDKRAKPTNPPGNRARALAARLSEAVAMHQSGDLDGAERAYREVLAVTRRDGDALHLLGVLLLQRGDAGQAESLIREAISSSPRVAEYHDNHGSALMALGRVEAAMLAHAVALRLNPEFAQARFNLGNALAASGDQRRAVAAFAAAVALRPDYVKAWYNLGNALRALTWYEAASHALARAARLDPAMPGVHTNLGDALSAIGELPAALEHQRLAVAASPESATERYNLGVILQQMGRREEAELAYRDALRRQPNHVGALNNLGSLLRRLNRPEQAANCHRLALIFLPEFMEAYYNLGNALQKLGRFAEAEGIYRKVLARNPEFAMATHNLGLMSLIQGDLAHGWNGLEQRFAAGEASPWRRPTVPRWRGEPLAGRRLLIWREQGVGDQMMFASCLGELESLDGQVIIETDPRLRTLFQRAFPWAKVRNDTCDGDGNETVIPSDADLHCPMGSLPLLLRGRLSAFPNPKPWLVAAPQSVQRWRARLAALGPGLKVGICWRSQFNDGERAPAYTKLEDWVPLARVPGLHLINLQYDDCADEIAAMAARHGVGPKVWPDIDLKNDFENTAALMSSLDLVVSVATSVGELAGALGVPVWRVGHPRGDWSMLGTRCRPWYPTMRVWSPRSAEELPQVLDRIARKLTTTRPGKDGSDDGADTTRRPAPPPRPREPSVDRLLSQALSAHRSGDLERAARAYRTVLTLAPDQADAAHLLGLTRHGNGAPADAERWIRRTLSLDPEFSLALNNLALVRQSLRDLDTADWCLRKAQALDPAQPDAASHIGVNHERAGRYQQALIWHRRAVRLSPSHAGFRNNHGSTLEFLGAFPQARAAYHTSLALAPATIPHTLSNLGNIHRHNGDLDRARRWFSRALALVPGFPLAMWNLGLIQLQSGDIASGWTGYERRFDAPELQAAQPIALPFWRGERLDGRRLLIWPEQGVGDEILFAASINALRHLDGTVVLECDPRLVPLFQRSFPWAEVRISAGRLDCPSAGNPLDCDLQLAQGSLPALLRQRVQDIGANAAPFLIPDPERVRVWRQRLESSVPSLRVGIAWKSQMSGARREAAYTTLEAFLPVMRLAGVTAINLQYGDCGDEIAACRSLHGVAPLEFTDLDLRDDFEGVAALIANLDLVLSPAISVGELAGAVGAPVWRFCGPDWTNLGSSVRPWFPTMRVIQPRVGEAMAAVTRLMAREIARLAPR